MVKALSQHIEKIIGTSFDSVVLEPYVEEIQLKKKDFLFQAGHPCTHIYFVVHGCLNLYFVNDRGQNQTVQFALENWWLTDFTAYRSGMHTKFFLQAVERGKVLAIHVDQEERLLADFPQLERYFRILHEKAYGASLMRMKYVYGYSKEELYHDFAQKFPEFVQRVPQYLLASFLGFTPEYLSELRRKV